MRKFEHVQFELISLTHLVVMADREERVVVSMAIEIRNRMIEQQMIGETIWEEVAVVLVAVVVWVVVEWMIGGVETEVETEVASETTEEVEMDLVVKEDWNPPKLTWTTCGEKMIAPRLNLLLMDGTIEETETMPGEVGVMTEVAVVSETIAVVVVSVTIAVVVVFETIVAVVVFVTIVEVVVSETIAAAVVSATIAVVVVSVTIVAVVVFETIVVVVVFETIAAAVVSETIAVVVVSETIEADPETIEGHQGVMTVVDLMIILKACGNVEVQ